MATNQRDVELRIAATTSGSEQVKQLSNQLEQLAKEGGLAAPEFKRLADELRKIGEQGDAVQALDALEQQVEQTGQALSTARTRAESLGQSLEAQRASTERYAENLLKAQSALRATETELRQLEAAQRLHRAETDRSEKSTVGYKDRARELATQLAALRNTLADQKAAVSDAKQAYDDQAAALKRAERANADAAKAATGFGNALEKQNAAVEASKKGLADLGVETTDAANALTRVEAALAETAAKTRELAQAQQQGRAIIEAVAASNERAAKMAKAAADERTAAARRVAAAEQEAAKAAEFSALKQKLAQESAAASAREAAAAAQAMNDAFAKTGVRSAAAIKAEIDGIVKALVDLRGNTRVSGDEFDRAFTTAQARVRALEAELRGIPAHLNNASSSAALLRQSLSQVTAAFGLFELGRGFITANNQLETMRRSLTLITGSGETAARQIEFLKDTANRAGLSYGALAQDFINFSAAANTSGIELQTQRDVFEQVANAAGQLGLSTDRVGLILQAFAQTASKGKVSLEELQGQLGESLPGALSIVANGFGVTKSQLLELVKAGVDTDKFFAAFVKGSKQAFGDGTGQVDGFRAAWERLKNTMADTATFFGNEGGVLAAFTTVLNQAAVAARGLGGAFELLGRIIGITAGAIANFDLTAPIESMRRWKDEIVAAGDEIQGRLDKANGAITASADSAVAAQNEVAAATANATINFQTSTTAELAAAAAAQQNTTAHTALAGATSAAGAAASGSAAGWAQMTIAYQQALVEAENQIVVAEKLAQAKKLEGDSRLAIIEISGNEAEMVRATAEAAKAEADALDYVSLKRQAEIDLLTRQRDALVEEQQIRGDASGARAKEIREIEQTIAAREAEAEKVRQSADATRVDAEAKAIAARTYIDNSAALGTLKDAYEKTQLALAAMVRAQQQGLATSEQVRDAQLRLAQAEALYKDAVEDSIAALERKVRAIQGTLSVTEAQISLDREKINSEIALAREMGNGYLVLEKSIQLKELDIKLAQAKVEALRLEAAALREEAAAALAALDANDPLLKQKQAEIELRMQNAKVKELEAAKTQEQIKQINAEIEAMRRRGVESSSTANQYVSDRGREVNAMEQVTRATEEAAAAERKRRNVDKNGWSTDMAGNTVSAGGETWLSIYNKAKSSGLSESQARQLAGEFAPNGQVPYFASAAQLKYGGPNSTIGYAIDRAIEQKIRAGSGGDGAGLSGVGLPDTLSPGGAGSVIGGSGLPSPTSGAGSLYTYKVDVKLGEKTTSIKTASNEDAQALTGLLQSLEGFANRSN